MNGSNRLTFGPISSPEELDSAIEQIAASYPGHLLLFRGQTSLHPTVRSGLSRPNVLFEPEVERGWSALVGKILGHGSAAPANVPFRRAVLQHYGSKTDYVDVTADHHIAAWFACNLFNRSHTMWVGSPIRVIEVARYDSRSEGTGYILIFVIPNAVALQTSRRLFDLSNIAPFLRPQRQRAWLLYDRAPLLPDPNDFWLATVEIDCARFSSALKTDYLFPLPTEDPGFKALLRTPFVQVHEGWSPSEKKQYQQSKHVGPSVLGFRLFHIPEYLHFTSDLRAYSHKDDEILTEAEPMQLWTGWHYELGERFPNIRGNVKDTTKITLSPRVQSVLAEPRPGIPLRWPELSTAQLLFTFSQSYYDRVGDVWYPYHGVWLHKDRDLILEHPMTADKNVLTVHAGHIFEFVGQELSRQDIPGSCTCGYPELHEMNVRQMLRLSALIEREEVILVPHPLRIPRWYFAF